MLQPDLQRIAHIRDYCIEIEKTITRYVRWTLIFLLYLCYTIYDYAKEARQ